MTTLKIKRPAASAIPIMAPTERPDDDDDEDDAAATSLDCELAVVGEGSSGITVVLVVTMVFMLVGLDVSIEVEVVIIVLASNDTARKNNIRLTYRAHKLLRIDMEKINKTEKGAVK